MVPYRSVRHQQKTRSAGLDIFQGLAASVEWQMVQYPKTDNQIVTARNLLNNVERLNFGLSWDQIKRRIRCAAQVCFRNPVQIASANIGNGLNAVFRDPLRDQLSLRLCFFES